MSSGSGSSDSEGENRRHRGERRNVRGRRAGLHQFLPGGLAAAEPEPLAAPAPGLIDFFAAAPAPAPLAAPAPGLIDFFAAAPAPLAAPHLPHLPAAPLAAVAVHPPLAHLPQQLPGHVIPPVPAPVPAPGHVIPPVPAVYAEIPEFPPFPLFAGGDNQEDYFQLFKKSLSRWDITKQLTISGPNKTFFFEQIKAILLKGLENRGMVRLSLFRGNELLGDGPVKLRVGTIGESVTVAWGPVLGEHVVQLPLRSQAVGWFKWIEVAGPAGELTVGQINAAGPNYTMHIVIQV